MAEPIICDWPGCEVVGEGTECVSPPGWVWVVLSGGRQDSGAGLDLCPVHGKRLIRILSEPSD